MNTQGIRGGSDAWSQFVKLTQEARLRNGGTAAAAKTGGAQGATRVAAFKPQAGAASGANGKSVQGAQGAPGELKKNTKILGGLFDAYA